MKTNPTLFRSALLNTRIAGSALMALSHGVLPALAPAEFKAAVDFVMECQSIVNMFVLSFGNDAEEIELDRECVAAEIEVSCDAALDIHGSIA